MRPVLLSTIEHSGTRFFVKLLAPLLGRYAVFADDGDQSVNVNLLVAHVQCRNLIARFVAERSPLVVTTMRQMDSLAASYERRLRPEDLPKRMADWQHLLRTYAPLVVSVDAADREVRLAALASALGIELTTDWSPTVEWPEVA